MRFHPHSVSAALFGLMFALCCFAEDKKETDAEREAKQAAEEEAAIVSKGEAAIIQDVKPFSGKLKMGPPESDDQSNPEVVAILTADSGDIYLVKLADRKLLEQLQPYDKKRISVTGKLRNENKYLIVLSITRLASGVPPEHHYRGKF